MNSWCNLLQMIHFMKQLSPTEQIFCFSLITAVLFLQKPSDYYCRHGTILQNHSSLHTFNYLLSGGITRNSDKHYFFFITGLVT